MNRDIDLITNELKDKTDRLIAEIGDRSFYLLSATQRRRRVRDIIRLYRRLAAAPGGTGKRRAVAAAAAASTVLLGGIPAHAEPPSFAVPTPNDMGIQVQQDAAYYAVMSLADIDGDGDLDFFAWAYVYDDAYGVVPVWQENIGSSRRPQFAQSRPMTEFGMPYFSGYDSSGFLLQNFADLDADGDLDAIGIFADYDNYAVDFAYVTNIGTRRSPEFADQAVRGARLSTNDADVEYLLYSRGASADIDGDGDLDIMLATTRDLGWYAVPGIVLLENSGSRRSPQFRSAEDNPFDLDLIHLTDSYYARLEFADIDGDGDQDIFVGCYTEATENGALLYMENTSTPTWTKFGGPLINPFGIRTPDEYVIAQPVFGDLDGDGDLDLLFGVDTDGIVYYSENLSR